VTPESDRIRAREDSVLRSIRQLMHAVDLYSRQLSATCNLTGPQLACLRQLQTSGAMTMTALAAAVSLSPATVSGILDRLEARELIQRERQSEDKRRVLVTLTAAGRAAVRRAPPSLQEQFSQRFRALSPGKQDGLERALREIVAMMEADRLDGAPLLNTSNDTGAAAGRR
jgi:DNA-binding MarR family transcriptional regulator